MNGDRGDWIRDTNRALAEVPSRLSELAAWIDQQEPERVDAVWVEAIAASDEEDGAFRFAHPAIGGILAAVRRAYRRTPAATPPPPTPHEARLAAVLRHTQQQEREHQIEAAAVTLRHAYKSGPPRKRWHQPTRDALVHYLELTGPRLAGQILAVIGIPATAGSRRRLCRAAEQDPRILTTNPPRGRTLQRTP